jgi:hypothetical protein
MAMMQMRMRMTLNKHRMPMINHCRMWSTAWGTGDVEGYKCEDDDDADTDSEEEASQPNAGSMQNVED